MKPQGSYLVRDDILRLGRRTPLVQVRRSRHWCDIFHFRDEPSVERKHPLERSLPVVAVRTTCPRSAASGHQACWPYTRAPRMVLEVCNEHKRAEPGHFSSNQFCQTVDTAHGTLSRSSAFAVDETDQQMRLPRMLLVLAPNTHIEVFTSYAVDRSMIKRRCEPAKATAMETLRQQHHVPRTLACECSTLAWPIPCARQGRRLANSASTRQSLQINYSTASASDAVTTKTGACTPHPAATMVGAGATGAGCHPSRYPIWRSEGGLPWEPFRRSCLEQPIVVEVRSAPENCKIPPVYNWKVRLSSSMATEQGCWNKVVIKPTKLLTVTSSETATPFERGRR